jgi:hypothetical protein
VIGAGLLAILVALGIAQHVLENVADAQARGGVQAPRFEVDPLWPKPLPNNWVLGQAIGLGVDAQDHVWIVHRNDSLSANEAAADQNPPVASCCSKAPPVLEFDPAGNLVGHWGGPGEGYEWPTSNHGIFIDHKNNVWIGGNGDKDAHVLKFTRDGRFQMQIGHQGKGGGSNDTENLGAPANMVIDAAANELYVADGYVNHRIIVFDATSGRYKRHWGAYGNRPDDGWFTRAGEKLPGPFSGAVQNENRPSQYDPNGPPAPQFRIVHAVRIANDGLVYVCDRTNDRLQVFRKSGAFVREVVIAKDTFGSGSVWDVGFSTDPQQAFLFINDGTNQLIYVLDRQTLEIVSTFGGAGHWAGQFYGAHNLAVNSKGDLFITETYEGKRVQRFINTGLGPPSVSP